MSSTAIATLSTPLELPCGAVIPNRLVKCPMQETLASLPFYVPPVHLFSRLYGLWGKSQYGLLITGQVQVDIRFLSKPGDVVVRKEALAGPELEIWKEWARIAKEHGTKIIVQLAHPGRMSPIGAGNRGLDEAAICPSVVPVALAQNWLEKKAVKSIFGLPRECTVADIDDVIESFVTGAKVALLAGFDGCQIHGAHGFLVSQFLSPYTNRRTDDYGGTPEKRLFFLQRIVREVRAACPAPYILSVKLNSGDYMKEGGLQPDEALEQVRWLVNCGMVDFIELSGGNAEGSQGSSRLANSFKTKSITKAPVIKESTRVRESFFSDFAERVAGIDNPRGVKIQLSGGFRSRVGMADAVESGICDLVGLGRAAVLQPDLPAKILLNPAVKDVDAFAASHKVRGLWLIPLLPIKVVGNSLVVGFFYYNMHRLGAGLKPDLTVSLPYLLFTKLSMPYRNAIYWRFWSLLGHYPIAIAPAAITVEGK